ncbi:energy transducer TonB [candidate division KSB1 bacterium]|nr:MAG: energy transducer TonB [candidate division KSB1 bacterium]
MNFYEQLRQGRYGSFELAKLVGPNLLRGLIISFLFHGAVVASPYILQLLKGEEEIPEPPIRVVDISQLTKLRSLQETASQVKIAAPKMAAPKAAIPIAVPEDEVQIDQALIPSQTEIATQVAASGDEGLDIRPGEQIEIKEEASADDIPDMGKFIPFEVAPQPLPDFSPQPAFPELAKTAGVTGKVVVQVYVDKRGEVKKWKIVKVDPKGLGFEDEVEKIITKWKFTPAIQQGNPVGVWVAVPFTFKYKKN